jgi:hypothetical protein
MRQRANSEQSSMWERVLFPQRLREPSGAAKPDPIPEPLLVAMAAIEQLEPVWIHDDAAFQWLVSANGLVGFPETNADNDALIEKARAEHIESFEGKSSWSSLSDHRKRFIDIWPRTDPAQAV